MTEGPRTEALERSAPQKLSGAKARRDETGDSQGFETAMRAQESERAKEEKAAPGAGKPDGAAPGAAAGKAAEAGPKAQAAEGANSDAAARPAGEAGWSWLAAGADGAKPPLRQAEEDGRKGASQPSPLAAGVAGKTSDPEWPAHRMFSALASAPAGEARPAALAEARADTGASFRLSAVAARMTMHGAATHFEPTPEAGRVELRGGGGEAGRGGEMRLEQLLRNAQLLAAGAAPQGASTDAGSAGREHAAPKVLPQAGKASAEASLEEMPPVAGAEAPAPSVRAGAADTLLGQVSKPVVAALASFAPAAAAPAPGAPVFAMKAGGAALKTLEITLKPEHLGTLDVTLRLKDGQLAVELRASHDETARMLAGDREGLRQLLEKAGFGLDDAAITIVARDAPTRSAQAPLDGGFSRSGDPAGQPGQDHPAEQGERKSQQGNRREAVPDAKAGGETTTAGRGPSVYI